MGDEEEAAPEPRGNDTLPRRHGRDSLEFARVMNLSDGLFAIALTLLVLDLGVDVAGEDDLGAALGDRVPNLIAFALAFGLAAHIWWLHHKVCAALAWVDQPMIAINLAGLAGVALVPFPTGLVGNAPDERAAVIPFILLFVVLSSVWLGFVVRAQAVGAWRRPMPAHIWPWLVRDWLATIGVLLVALAVAAVSPIAALVLLTAGSLAATVLLAKVGPPERAAWF